MRRKPVHIIDHDPLETETRTVFGKRRQANEPRSTTTAGAASKEPAAQSVSDYFFDRLNPSRPSATIQKRSAVNTTIINKDRRRSEFAASVDDNEGLGLPIKSIAAVLALTIIVPTAAIFITENLPNRNIDPITTASLAQSGLSVQDVSMTRILKNGTFVVTINGKISNTGSSAKILQPLDVQLENEDGMIIQSWRHRLGKNRIKPGETLRFVASAIDIKSDAKNVRIIAKTATP